MSYKRNSSNSSLIDDSSGTTENSILAKLRRLKIEENLLINSINKINIKETGRSKSELPIFYSSELKTYTGKLKNSLIEMKNMVGELKVMAEETLTSDDIENMKRDVVELDEKIRLVKSYVQTELAMESTTEKELTQQENVEERQLKRSMKPKIRIKPFNNIVPSPVKVMIQSPFKCQEVQNFQEFMMSSPNRYGGWNEYHHNVFVQIWRRHFKGIDEITVNDAQFYNQGLYESFQTEILEKVTGSMEDDVLSHFKWYCKYLFLKEQQQNALNKWKKNKRMLLKSDNKFGDIDQKSSMDTSSKVLNSEAESTSIENVEELMDTMETCDAEEIANALCEVTIQDGLSIEAEINMSSGDRSHWSQDAIKRKERSFNNILKPTKQWTNRCNSSSIGVKVYNDVETIKKLRIPDWRMPLKD